MFHSLFELRFELGQAHARYRRSCLNDYVQPRGADCPTPSKYLPEAPPGPVSYDRITDLAAYRKPETTSRHAVGEDDECEVESRDPHTPCVNCLELPATEEAILDSLFTATTTAGFRGTVTALPVAKVLELAGVE